MGRTCARTVCEGANFIITLITYENGRSDFQPRIFSTLFEKKKHLVYVCKTEKLKFSIIHSSGFFQPKTFIFFSLIFYF